MVCGDMGPRAKCAYAMRGVSNINGGRMDRMAILLFCSRVAAALLLITSTKATLLESR